MVGRRPGGGEGGGEEARRRRGWWRPDDAPGLQESVKGLRWPGLASLQDTDTIGIE